MVVKFTKLEHPGGVYVYRVHNEKLNKFCNFDPEFIKLKKYVYSMFEECPNDYFGSGPRGSCLKFKTNNHIIELKGHQVCNFAKNGLEVNSMRCKNNHSKVQLFMLENDDNTVAVEVPVWMQTDEIPGYQKLFESDAPLTGHIDVLGFDNDKIWVWDYKPNAHKEKYADTQVYFYSMMLSKRTGIPLDKFMCGYFDAQRAYIFKPEPFENKKIFNASLASY